MIGIMPIDRSHPLPDNLQQVKPEPTGQHYRQTVNRWTSPIGQLPIISVKQPSSTKHRLQN